jgi:hypothetical protein
VADESNISSQNTPRWIVLIDKTPRGPLEQSEIELLIQQGVIRRNDFAILVSNLEEKASWKFLWQFPQFDRRKKEMPATPNVAAAPVPVDRRAHTPPPIPTETRELP